VLVLSIRKRKHIRIINLIAVKKKSSHLIISFSYYYCNCHRNMQLLSDFLQVFAASLFVCTSLTSQKVKCVDRVWCKNRVLRWHSRNYNIRQCCCFSNYSKLVYLQLFFIHAGRVQIKWDISIRCTWMYHCGHKNLGKERNLSQQSYQWLLWYPPLNHIN